VVYVLGDRASDQPENTELPHVLREFVVVDVQQPI
jgi:hypothetical protein